jgi:hypothetical protein
MESCSTFSDSLTTAAIGLQQQPVVWDLPLSAGPEGPTLISRTARLLGFGSYMTAFSSHRRGAQSSA